MSASPLLRFDLADERFDAQLVRACPSCHCASSTLLHRVRAANASLSGEFELRACTWCRLVHVTPRLSDDALAQLYGEEFYFSTGWAYAPLAARVIEWIQSRRRHRVERHVHGGRLLDIGCGDGSFVHHMARHGWDATGIDFSSAALDYARQFDSGGHFELCSLEDYVAAPRQLDLITMWQVLEHIGEPLPLLHRCRELLRPGGVFVASVPNLDGLSARLTGARWWGLDVPRHLVHFTPATLRRVLERSGFEVLFVHHRSLQYDPYALLHSTLDWVFTRRHFLSDFAKRQVTDSPKHEYAYNLFVLAALAPVLAPLCLLATSVAALCRRGGFIEVHARRR